ncbi:MAG: c-type cytochrome [Gemmatimonadota bacterium]|nr:MAG: c-type cytochrome [Gemmatimonadota bacterium]
MKAFKTAGRTAGLLAMVALASPGQASAQRSAVEVRTISARLTGSPRAVGVEQATSGTKETFNRLCAACHGAEGKGNGRAAAAFDPRPPDFTDAELWVDRTDEELASSIADGIREMPGFDARLKPEEIAALVKYIRTLSGAARPSPRRTAL